MARCRVFQRRYLPCSVLQRGLVENGISLLASGQPHSRDPVHLQLIPPVAGGLDPTGIASSASDQSSGDGAGFSSPAGLRVLSLGAPLCFPHAVFRGRVLLSDRIEMGRFRDFFTRLDGLRPVDSGRCLLGVRPSLREPRRPMDSPQLRVGGCMGTGEYRFYLTTASLRR